MPGRRLSEAEMFSSMTAQRPKRTRLPSAGFCALSGVHVGLLAFLIWGLTKPPLERVWELHHELKIGRVGRLETPDAELLSSALRRHPRLAAALLDKEPLGLVSAHSAGWLETAEATVLRSVDAADPCKMELEVRMPNEAFPVSIEVAAQGWGERVVMQDSGATWLALPKGSGAAEIISLIVRTRTPRQDGETLGVRAGFACAKRASAE